MIALSILTLPDESTLHVAIPSNSKLFHSVRVNLSDTVGATIPTNSKDWNGWAGSFSADAAIRPAVAAAFSVGHDEFL